MVVDLVGLVGDRREEVLGCLDACKVAGAMYVTGCRGRKAKAIGRGFKGCRGRPLVSKSCAFSSRIKHIEVITVYIYIYISISTHIYIEVQVGNNRQMAGDLRRKKDKVTAGLRILRTACGHTPICSSSQYCPEAHGLCLFCRSARPGGSIEQTVGQTQGQEFPLFKRGAFSGDLSLLSPCRDTVLYEVLHNKSAPVATA